MSMHLESPALTMSGKKKGKKKFASAEAKRNADILAKEWEDINKKWAPKAVVRKVFKTESLSPAMSTPRNTNTSNVPSLVTPGGNCAKKDPILYTGTKVLGVATMHKSNMVPIFSDQEAVDVATMRR